MKRKILLAAAILAVTTVFAGCGDNAASDQSNSSAAQSAVSGTQSGDSDTSGDTSSAPDATSSAQSTDSTADATSTTSETSPASPDADKPTTVADLSLEDGEYTIGVTLEGGSGKTTVTSPTKLIIKDGAATAEVELSSSKYDYMKVDGVKYDMINTEGNSKFLIPVSGFDYKMPIAANTTAMGNPHEIEYTLFFDSTTIS